MEQEEKVYEAIFQRSRAHIEKEKQQEQIKAFNMHVINEMSDDSDEDNEESSPTP